MQTVSQEVSAPLEHKHQEYQQIRQNPESLTPFQKQQNICDPQISGLSYDKVTPSSLSPQNHPKQSLPPIPAHLSSQFQDLFPDFSSPDSTQKLTSLIQINFFQQYQETEQRLIKRIIRKYHHSKQIKHIEYIYLLVNQKYPSIQLQYSIDQQKQPQISILQLFRGINKDEVLNKQMRKFIRSLFYCNYIEITNKNLAIYSPAIEEKLYELNLQHYSFFPSHSYPSISTVPRSIMSCYSLHEDQWNFLAVDYNWNELRFNHIFVELNSDLEEFQGCYEAVVDLIKRNKTEEGDKDGERMGVGEGEEVSSGDEDKECGEEREIIIDDKEIRKKLEILFKEQLDEFKCEIEEKEYLMQQMNESKKSNKQQQVEKLKEQIKDLKTNLSNYRSKRSTLKSQYNSLSLSSPSSILLPIHQQLQMLRTQLSSRLPILSHKLPLFSLLSSHHLLLLSGSTGCGKSTQLPQLLLQYFSTLHNPISLPILITQPRKLATRTLASRISYQLQSPLHSLVDYQTSARKKPSKTSKVVVMYDKVLLDELEEDGKLSKYQCLLIDEAHERTWEGDVILGMVRKLLEVRKDFWVIVTSATMDVGLFQEYFSEGHGENEKITVPTLKISRRLYPVEIIYKPYDNQKSNVQKIKKVLNNQILKYQHKRKYHLGHILVFCSTPQQTLHLKSYYSNKPGLKPLALHPKLSPHQQSQIFSPSLSLTKLIFSTRLAQTSITIDNIHTVIDPGYDQQSSYDQKKRITTYQLKPISKSSAQQRTGRAGRTQGGVCFRLYSREFYEGKMVENKVGEVKRMGLDGLVLRLKGLGVGRLEELRWVERPDEEGLREAEERMKGIGGLNERREITEMGRVLGKMGVEPWMGRALIEGMVIEKKTKRKILKRLLKTLVMIVNGQNIFVSSFDEDGVNEENNEEKQNQNPKEMRINKRQEFQRVKLEQFADKQGDFFSLLRIFELFEQQALNPHTLGTWCSTHYLNKSSLFQALSLYNQTLTLLSSFSPILNLPLPLLQHILLKQSLFKSDYSLILSCLLPSFIDQLSLYSGNPKIGYTSLKRSISLQISGSSFLMLQGIYPKWIIGYDVFKTTRMYCRLAQGVDFEVLRMAVGAEWAKREKLEECEKENMYYVRVVKKVGSLVFKEVKRIYETNVTDQFNFLQESALIFLPESSSIQLYISRPLSQTISQKFTQKLSKISHSFSPSQSPYTHHYLGTVTSLISSGCYPTKINFSHYLYAVKILNISYSYQKMINLFYMQGVVKSEFNEKGLVMYFEEEAERKKFREWLDGFMKVEGKREEKGMVVKMEKGFDERKDKVAAVEMRVRFFVGKQRKVENFVVLGYTLEEAEKMEGLMSLHAKGKNFEFSTKINRNKSRESDKVKITIILSKDPKEFDEIDFEEMLDGKMKNVVGWKKPTLIKGFREVDQTLSCLPPEHWIEKLKVYLPDVSQDDITLKGFSSLSSQSSNPTDYTAHIRMYDTYLAQSFKLKHNNKRNILGNEKVHIDIKYTQTILRTTPFIFQIYLKKYTLKKQEILQEFPQLKIEEKEVRGRGGGKSVFLLIELVSENREDIARPSVMIKEVFKPVNIQLSSDEMEVLRKKVGVGKNGKEIYLYEGIFEEIRWEYGEEIELEIGEKGMGVKVYWSGGKDMREEVKGKLREKIGASEKLIVMISYKGKNIHDVKRVLEKYNTENQLYYRVIFSLKIIEAIGRLETLTQLENQILSLSLSVSSSNSLLSTPCPICDDSLHSPYTLHNCSHTFCRYCLVSSIRISSQQQQKYPIKCPHHECKQLLNINDIKMLVQYQEFNRMCDRGVKILMNMKSEQYHGCFSNDCDMVFDVKESKKKGRFRCGLCTVEYCYECKQLVHPNMTCWQIKVLRNPEAQKEDEMLEKMGYKRCGRCWSRVERSAGCNHIACKCGAHFCWKCGETYGTSKECYKHLNEKHGGAFDFQERLVNIRQPEQRFPFLNQNFRFEFQFNEELRMFNRMRDMEFDDWDIDDNDDFD